MNRIIECNNKSDSLIMNNLKSLILIPIFYNSEKEYLEKWEKRFTKNFQINERAYSEDMQINFRDLTLSQEPISHRFNNVLGYAELILDYPDILIFYHLNGDRRKKYNKNKSCVGGKGKIYEANIHVVGGRIRNLTNKTIKKAIQDSLKEIKNQSDEWNVFVDFTTISKKLKYFDFKRYFQDYNL